MAHGAEAPAMGAGRFRSATVRGVEGFFRVAQDHAGRWWLVTPEGAAFFACAVHGVRAPGVAVDGGLPLDPAGRLRRWGFNAVGVGPDGVGGDDGLPFLAAVEFCRAGRSIALAGMRLPDVFDPAWPELAAAWAREACASQAENRALIGWVTDDRPGWAQPTPAGRPSLLQICLSLEPSFPAYHAAWEFVLALHGGRLAGVAQAWHAPIANKEVVRELTRAEEGLGTRGYLRDEARWTREFARRYFTTTAAAVRAADPHHLVLGCRFEGHAGPQVRAECVYPAVDAALLQWTELPPAVDAQGSQPVLAGDVSWAEPAFRALPAGAKPRRLTSVERMLRRGRTTLDRLARHPAVVGYAWSRWEDEPGEQPPFAHGLVHVNGREAFEHTEVLAQFNARAEDLRCAADTPGTRRRARGR